VKASSALANLQATDEIILYRALLIRRLKAGYESHRSSKTEDKCSRNGNDPGIKYVRAIPMPSQLSGPSINQQANRHQ
jgi:hypothetical protein